MSIRKYINKNKIGGLILIIVIIIAFGFGGFGGGFMSNNQNNVAKIDKINITSQDLVNYINRSGITQKAIQDNLNNNIIEELLSTLVSTTLLDLEVKDFNIKFSKNSLSQIIKLNDNFVDENGVFQRIKYEKFLLENNTSAPIFEKRLKDREVQKKLFDYIGAGTVSPQFLVKKLFENENKKLQIDYIDLENFYKKNSDIKDQDIIKFIDENIDRLKVEHIDFKYSVINPKNLIGIDEYNQEFFDIIDEIENSILNGIDFNTIISEFNLNLKTISNYEYSNDSNNIEKKIYEVRNNDFDIFENEENFILYKIEKIQEKKPDINDPQTKDEILKLVIQKNKFDYNKNLLEKINNKNFKNDDFIKMGKNKIENIKLNSIRDNNKFDINAVELMYSLPINTFTLINDDKNNIYLAKIKSFSNDGINEEKLEEYTKKQNSYIKNSMLKSYDLFLNDKYEVVLNQKTIERVKNFFQ